METWKPSSRQTFRKVSCNTDIQGKSGWRHCTGLWRTLRSEKGSVQGCLEDRSRDAGVVKNSFWFLSVVQHFDQMDRSIINQLLSILTRSYHIRDLLRSMWRLLLNYGEDYARVRSTWQKADERMWASVCSWRTRHTQPNLAVTLLPIALMLRCYEASDKSLGYVVR